MAFKTLKSNTPLFRARREAVSRTMARLHAMTDPFLARNLIKLAREARTEAPDQLGNPTKAGYEIALVWQVIPLLAKRVGGVSLLPNEGNDADIVRKTDQELRETVGICLNNSSLDRLARTVRGEESAKPSALDLLGNGFINGNPIAMTTDRLHPPAPEGEDHRDWLARHMREISQSRFGDTRYAAWEPDFQNYKQDLPFRFDMDKVFEEIEAEMDEGPSRA